MKQSGRISLVLLASIVSVVVVAGILIFSRESMSSVGQRFIEALYAKDVDTLTKMTMMSETPTESIHKQWDHAVNVAGKYYMFAYKIEGATQSGPNSGSVKIQIVKDVDKPTAFPEHVEIPMVKVGDEWKVDIRNMDHELYPGLPR